MLALCTAVCIATIAQAQEESSLVRQLYNGGWPDKDTVAQLNKERSNTYKMHPPAGIPAKLYWAVTVYNPIDGTMPQTDQPFPSRNQFDRPPSNPDGSLDLYFGPTKPDGVDAKNWIQTLRGKAFVAALRLYGTSTEFYDQTWKPDDLVKISGAVGSR